MLSVAAHMCLKWSRDNLECMTYCWVRVASSTWNVFWFGKTTRWCYFRSKFRKRLGSLSIVSLNNNDKKEVLEHQSYSGKQTEF